MDLDKIRKEWQETSIKVNVGEDKIIQMVDNKGQSAYRNLLNYERAGILFAIILWFVASVFKYKEMIIFYQVTIGIAFFWQIFKVTYLRKIDFLNMSILDISRFYIFYKKIMTYETVVGFVWFVVFTGCYGYAVHIHTQKLNITVYCIVMGVCLLVGIWILWYFIWRNIRRLGKSIREVKEFERDNK